MAEVFLLTKPTDKQIRNIIASNREASFSYTELGYTKDGPLPEITKYNWDSNRVLLGHGESIFNRATEAVKNWKMFDFEWGSLRWPNTPIDAGQIVGAVFTHFGFWSANFCRIVYVIDEKGPIDRFGFAYGTLDEHAERGEERFSVEWNHKDDSVWYDILAFSQPRNIFARIGYPVSRRMQRKFVRDSKQSMQRAVAGK
jgi:uncharacterized protein (UPF0548 family)